MGYNIEKIMDKVIKNGRCDNCGAFFKKDASNSFYYCPYCGNIKKELDDSNINNEIERKNIKRKKGNKNEKSINEIVKDSNERISGKDQEVSEVENSIIDIEEIEKIFKKKKSNKKKPLIAVGILAFIFIALLSNNNPKFYMPIGLWEFRGKNVEYVKKELQNMGFKNIVIEEVEDKWMFLIKEGDVKTISIDGNTKIKEGDYVSKNSKVYITYYVKKRE